MPSQTPNIPNTEVQSTEVIKNTIFKTTKIGGINQGTFPKKVHLGSRSLHWVKAEVLQWVNEQLAVRTKPPQARG